MSRKETTISDMEEIVQGNVKSNGVIDGENPIDPSNDKLDRPALKDMNNDSLDDSNIGEDKVAFSSNVQLATEIIKKEVVDSETLT